MKTLRSVLALLPGPVLIAGLGIIGLYLLGRWDQSIGERDRALDQQTKAALEMSRTWSESYNGAVTAAAEDSAQLARLRLERRVAQREADALARQLDELPEPQLDDATGWRMRYQLRTGEVQKLRSALTTAQGELIVLRRDRDRGWLLADSAYTVVILGLEQALRDERDARRCRILGLIPCPSRTTAFVAGGAMGAIVVFALVR